MHAQTDAHPAATIAAGWTFRGDGLHSRCSIIACIVFGSDADQRCRELLGCLCIFLLASCAGEPAQVAKAPVEVRESPDVPTYCASKEKPCVPPSEFVEQLCQGRFASVAPYLFQKHTPFERHFVKNRNCQMKTAFGGPTGEQPITFAEELLLLRVKPGALAQGKKAPAEDLDFLRWDGTCVTLPKRDVATYLPGVAKAAPLEFDDLDTTMRAAVVRDKKLDALHAARETACKQDPKGSVCEKARKSLSDQMVTAIRASGGTLTLIDACEARARVPLLVSIALSAGAYFAGAMALLVRQGLFSARFFGETAPIVSASSPANPNAVVARATATRQRRRCRTASGFTASARASTFKILLVDLNPATGSLAGMRSEDVIRLHWTGSSAGCGGSGYSAMANVGWLAPAGEYPRDPGPRVSVTRRTASDKSFWPISSAASF